jgi:FAD dependent oxidoreductase
MTVERLSKSILEPARETPVAAEADVLVAGGGVAGIAAAVGAARAGANTLLVEQLGFLGGTASGTMMLVITYHERHLHGFVRQLLHRMAAEGGAVEGEVIPFDPECYKRVALEMVVDSGARPLLYTQTVAPIVEADTIGGVIIENKAGRQALLAKTVIDCTGDADLAFRAGAPLRKGREEDGRMRPVTMIFRVGNVNYAPLLQYVADHPDQFSPEPTMHLLDPATDVIRLFGFYDLIAEAKARHLVNQDTHYLRLEGGSIRHGIAVINTTRIYDVDGTDPFDLTRAELEGRRQVQQVCAFLRALVPGFEASVLLDTSTYLGIRETRHVLGDHTLTAQEIRADAGAPDAIGRAYTTIAPGSITHPPERNEGAPSNLTYRMPLPVLSYDIPYGMTIVKGLNGLLAAGRNASASNEAFESCRGMATCMHMGFGAGIAAAVAARAGVTPRQVDIQEVQRLLAAQGVEVGKGARGILAAPLPRRI